MVNLMLPALTALAGVIIGTYLSHLFGRKRDQLELKRDVLRRIMGHRWTLAEGYDDPEGHFFTALNEALVVFAGDNNVENEIETFRMVISEGRFRAETLQPLVATMAKSAKVQHAGWNKTLFEYPFTPKINRSGVSTR